MFNPDAPIRRITDDLLDRKLICEQLAEAIKSWKKKESLIIALCGKWGSGKSSVIQIVKKSLFEKDPEEIDVVEFNPWLFSNNLTAHFFDEISKKLSWLGLTSRILAYKFRVYSNATRFVSPGSNFWSVTKYTWAMYLYSTLVLLIAGWSGSFYVFLASFLPIIGVLLMLFSIITNWLREIYKIQIEKPIDYIKLDLKKKLLKRGKKILVIIDDLDRVSAVEFKEVLRLIRINGDLPHMIYLLAFDQSIADSYFENDREFGNKYLEKIVQVQLDLPLPSSIRVADYLSSEVTALVKELPSAAQLPFHKGNDEYWREFANSGLISLFKNLREVKKFVNTLSFNVGMLHKDGIIEVNIVDFIGLEAIRVFAHDFYVFLRANQDLLISRIRSEPDKEQARAILRTNFDLLPSDIKDNIVSLTCKLFPQVDMLLKHDHGSYGTEWEVEWQNDLKICSHHHINIYFKFNRDNTDADISEREFSQLQQSLNNTDEIESKLLEAINTERIGAILDKFRMKIPFTKDITQAHLVSLVTALFNISDRLPLEGYSPFVFSPIRQLVSIVDQALGKEDVFSDQFTTLVSILSNTKGLYGPARFLTVIQQDKTGDLKLTEEQILSLRTLVVNNIAGKSDEQLLNNNYLLTILLCWKDWDTELKWKEFIDRVCKDSSKYILLINCFFVLITNMNKIEKALDYSVLKQFVDLDSLVVKMKEKLASPNIFPEETILLQGFIDNLNLELTGQKWLEDVVGFRSNA